MPLAIYLLFFFFFFFFLFCAFRPLAVFLMGRLSVEISDLFYNKIFEKGDLIEN